ncbi:hypothetical protein P4K96_15855, partial [Bacillus cereus]|nr:hypothetical protein [Bacillus cereus]
PRRCPPHARRRGSAPAARAWFWESRAGHQRISKSPVQLHVLSDRIAENRFTTIAPRLDAARDCRNIGGGRSSCHVQEAIAA